ncbi:MAG: glycosyltransferase [Actinomycetota bacterium]
MIVRNGAQTIERCISSIRPHVDEVCIYDTGSTDATLELLGHLASEPGAPIIIEQGEWRDDFAWARNQSFAMASSDYAAFFDDDEALEGGEHLRTFLDGSPDGIYVQHVCVWNSDLVSWGMTLRAIKLSLRPQWESPVHARLAVSLGCNSERVAIDPSLTRVIHHALIQPGRHQHHRRLVETALKQHPTPYLLHYLGLYLLEDGDLSGAAKAFTEAVTTPIPWRLRDLEWVIDTCELLVECYARLDDEAGLVRALRTHALARSMYQADPFRMLCRKLNDEAPIAGDDPLWTRYADDPRTETYRTADAA